MKKILLALIAAAIVPCASVASPLTDDLARCLTDSTTGKDRKDLAKWIFVGMSAHPEMKALAPVAPAASEAAQRTMAELFTKLIATSCTEPFRKVVVAEGANGAKVAFENLGKIAMAELMTNPQVNAAMTGFEMYIDKSKIEAAMKAK